MLFSRIKEKMPHSYDHAPVTLYSCTSSMGTLLGTLETLIYLLGFPGGPDGKQSACNAGDRVNISTTTMGNDNIGFVF